MPTDPIPSSPASGSEHESLAARRKRALLSRAAHGLKRRLTTYRTLAIAAAVALAALATYAITDTNASDEAPARVLLGTGQAGIEGDPTADVAAAADADPEAEDEHVGEGRASYYGDELAGNPTASGERFDPAKLTAAHRTLPLGSRVRVTNLRTGESVVVRINDRGPFHDNRIIDISEAAARRIGMLKRGTARVRLELLARL